MDFPEAFKGITIAGTTITKDARYQVVKANVTDVVEAFRTGFKPLDPNLLVKWQIPKRSAIVTSFKYPLNLRFTGLAMGSQTVVNKRLMA